MIPSPYNNYHYKISKEAIENASFGLSDDGIILRFIFVLIRMIFGKIMYWLPLLLTLGTFIYTMVKLSK